MKKRNVCLILVVVFCLTILAGITAVAAKDPRTNAPVITEMTVSPRSDGRFLVTVKTEGNPYPTYQWKMLDEDGEVVLIPGANGSIMMLKGFEPGTEYSFQVEVRSHHGNQLVVSKWVSATAQ